VTRTVRLRYVAEVNPRTLEFEQLPDEASVAFLPLEAVWPSSSLNTSRVRSKGEVATGYTRFRTGDILIPKITPTFQANCTVLAPGLVGGVGAGTTELHVVRPRPLIEPRYLLYTLSSQPFLQEGEASMTEVAGQKRVPDEFVRDMNVLMRPIVEQRAIADYLEAEISAMDDLLTKKQRLVGLLQERIDSAIMELVGHSVLVRDDMALRALPLHRELAKLDRPPESDAPMITAFRDGQVTARALRRSEGFTESWTEGAQVQGVCVGDVVVHGLDGFAGAIGTSEADGVCSPVYHVCAPLEGGDAHFYGRMLRILATTGYLGKLRDEYAGARRRLP
jgi:hypothetical protein